MRVSFLMIAGEGELCYARLMQDKIIRTGTLVLSLKLFEVVAGEKYRTAYIHAITLLLLPPKQARHHIPLMAANR
jgi:hypothetical protein